MCFFVRLNQLQSEVLRRKYLSSHVNSAVIELTTECNKSCNFCYNAYGRNESTSQIKNPEHLISFLSEMGIKNIILSGGETLLYSKLFDCIQKFDSMGMRITVITNGLLLDKETVKRLKHYNCYIRCTIDTMREAKRLIPLLKQHDYLDNSIVNFTYYDQDISAFKELITYAHTSFTLRTDVNMAVGIECSSSILDQMVEISIWCIEKRLLEKYNIVGQTISALIDNYFRLSSLHSFNCSICNDIKIDVNGLIYPCPFFKGHEWVIGNAKKAEWDGNKVKKLKEIVHDRIKFNPECQACDINFICGGGCLISLENKNRKNDYCKNAQSCAIIRRIFEYLNAKFQIYR